jgi:hypothetical protein
MVIKHSNFQAKPPAHGLPISTPNGSKRISLSGDDRITHPSSGSFKPENPFQHQPSGAFSKPPAALKRNFNMTTSVSPSATMSGQQPSTVVQTLSKIYKPKVSSSSKVPGSFGKVIRISPTPLQHPSASLSGVTNPLACSQEFSPISKIEKDSQQLVGDVSARN